MSLQKNIKACKSWLVIKVRLVNDRNDANCRFDRTEAATRGVLWKKVFLEISQNSQENTCAKVSFLIKLLASPL